MVPTGDTILYRRVSSRDWDPRGQALRWGHQEVRVGLSAPLVSLLPPGATTCYHLPTLPLQGFEMGASSVPGEMAGKVQCEGSLMGGVLLCGVPLFPTFIPVPDLLRTGPLVTKPRKDRSGHPSPMNPVLQRFTGE